MSLINRFETPPRPWPPASGPHEITEAVDFTRRRDPIGHAVHTALAVLAAFGLSVSTATASITMTMLVVYTFLRLPNAWRGLVPLVRSPLVLAWLAWFAWAALSGLWTPDLLDWGDSLGGFPALLLFPAFFLVSGAWRAILGGFVAGAAFQGAAQVVHASVPAWRPEWQPRFDGLATHPGQVSTVSAMAALVAIAWLADVQEPRSRRWLVLGLAGCLVSVALGAGRGAMVGLACGGAAMAFALACRHGLARRVVVVGLGGLVATVVAFGLAALGFGPDSLVHVVRDTRPSVPDSSIAQRLLWWQASWDAFLEHPVAGLGTGATATWFAESPRITEYAATVPNREREFFTAPHPHSIYLLTLAEQGLVGVGLMLAVLWTTLASAWRTTALRPVACGLLGAIVAWWAAGGFDSVNLPVRIMAPLVLVSTFACLPRGPGVGLGIRPVP